MNSISRSSCPPSTSLPPGPMPMSSTPISILDLPQYSMQPQYRVSQTHTLPPAEPQYPQSPSVHHYMGQPYWLDLSRCPSPPYNVYGAITAVMMAHTTAHHQQYLPLLPSILPPTFSARINPQPIVPVPQRDCHPDYNGLSSGSFSYSGGKCWDTIPAVMDGNGYPYAIKSPRIRVVSSHERCGILPQARAHLHLR